MKFLKIFGSLFLAVALLVASVACGPTSQTQYKQIVQIGFDTFIAAEAIYNPAWPTVTIKEHGDAAIAAWGVGASWQQNVLNELVPVFNIVQSIPQCDQQCSMASLVFEGGLSSVMVYLESQGPQTVMKATAMPRVGVQTYKSFSDYKKSWNKVAPSTAKIK